MIETNMENLSAAMDGELSREELRFLLRRLDHDASLLNTWTRYHLVGEGLRGGVPAIASHGFASRVMAAIADEQADTHSPRRDWLRLAMGGVIAASVAAAALIVSQPLAPDAERASRLAVSGGASGQGVRERASFGAAHDGAARLVRADTLAAAPPSLSPYSPWALSQRASVTLGNPSANPLFQGYRGQNYSVQGYQGYKALDNQDGGYLLLIDSSQAQPVAAPGAR